jgi:long-chain fatty acid transport protein
MSESLKHFRAVLLMGAGLLAIGASASGALAGGFALREQSAYYQGMSFAGIAAGDGLSAIFWNPAAVANFDGTNTSSTYTLIIPHAEIHVNDVDVPHGPIVSRVAPITADLGGFDSAGADSGDIAGMALTSASYANYQVSQNLYVGMSFNGPFGLATEPDEDLHYLGSVLARTGKLFTLNGSPTIGFKLAPGLMIGGGAQIEWAEGTFKFATGSPVTDSTSFKGDDWAFGGTAGVLWQPSSSTSIGLGWRSQLSHTLEGTFKTPETVVPLNLVLGGVIVGTTQLRIAETATKAEVDLELPDIVTLSLRQKLSSSMRVSGTVEWTNWSRFQELNLKAAADGVLGDGTVVAKGDTIALIEANWDDGWFFALGGEFDWTDAITLRGGVAYEISPVDDPTKRIISIPDSDRVWLSTGLTYHHSATTTVDVGATFIFLEDAEFDRTSTSGVHLTGETQAHTVILSAGLNTKW